jgi:hypothetical protein
VIHTKLCSITTVEGHQGSPLYGFHFECAVCGSSQYVMTDHVEDGIELSQYENHSRLWRLSLSSQYLDPTEEGRLLISCELCGQETGLALVISRAKDGIYSIALSSPEEIKLPKGHSQNCSEQRTRQCFSDSCPVNYPHYHGFAGEPMRGLLSNVTKGR